MGGMGEAKLQNCVAMFSTATAASSVTLKNSLSLIVCGKASFELLDKQLLRHKGDQQAGQCDSQRNHKQSYASLGPLKSIGLVGCNSA